MTTPQTNKAPEFLTGIFRQRLAQIHCEQLPQAIRNKLLADFIADCLTRIDRVANRSITVPSIARVFTELAKEQKPKGERNEQRACDNGGGSGGGFDLPPDELGITKLSDSERRQFP